MVNKDALTPVEPGDTRTRDRVLAAITQQGPITAAQVAKDLGLTATGVRRHLDHLADAGLIEDREVAATGKRGRGRPARAWVVSSSGHDWLPDDYNTMAVDALRFLRDRAGADAVRGFADDRIARLEERYAEEVSAAGEDPAARAEALVAALRRDGFAASVRPMGAPSEAADSSAGPSGNAAGTARGGIGVQLCQGHCPVQQVATEFPEFCEAEADAFSRLLGVHVQRLATLAQGDHVCTTFIPTTNLTAPTSLPTPTSIRTERSPR